MFGQIIFNVRFSIPQQTIGLFPNYIELRSLTPNAKRITKEEILSIEVIQLGNIKNYSEFASLILKTKESEETIIDSIPLDVAEFVKRNILEYFEIKNSSETESDASLPPKQKAGVRKKIVVLLAFIYLSQILRIGYFHFSDYVEDKISSMSTVEEEVEWSEYLGRMDWEKAKEKCQSSQMQLPVMEDFLNSNGKKAKRLSGGCWSDCKFWTLQSRNSDSAILADINLYDQCFELSSDQKWKEIDVRCVKYTGQRLAAVNQQKSDCEGQGRVWGGELCQDSNENSFQNKGLEWDLVPQDSKTWDQATSICKKKGKRLPTLDELKANWISLPLPDYAFQTEYWTDTKDEEYDWRYTMTIDGGAVHSTFREGENAGYEKFVCVKGNSKISLSEKKSYLDPQKEVGLHWSGYQGKLQWQDAEDKCKNLGMRLPTRKELSKLYNDQVPWRNAGCKSGCSFWSANSYMIQAAFFVSMVDGGSGWSGDKRKQFSDATSDVRCVK